MELPVKHPLCNGNIKKLCSLECDLCFSRSFATHPKSVCWSSNNVGTPRDYFRTSGKKCKFDCKDCGHEIEAALGNVAAGKWCVYCNNLKLCSSDNCVCCFEKSFASHPKASFWLPENATTPRMVLVGTKAKYKFKCGDCGHVFECPLADLTAIKSACMFCSGQRMCYEAECEKCFDMSFASHPKSVFWSSKNEKTPREMFKNSAIKCIFDCDKCGHEYITSLSHVVEGKWCSFCCGQQRCKDPECKPCFNKTMASHKKAKYWSPKNAVTPREVPLSESNKKYLFDCKYCGQEYLAYPHHVKTGSWCRCTYNKTETKLHKWLREKFPEQVFEKQKAFDWCKKGKHLPFDFYCDEWKLVIELDGRQHFEQVYKWPSPEDNHINDIHKMNLANKHDICVVRIYQPDVWADQFEWDKKLKIVLENREKKNILIGGKYILSQWTTDTIVSEICIE